ncbi:MAG: glycosyltransferase [Patescibacteria group bacterium]
MISFIVPVYNKGSILFKTLSSLLVHLKKTKIADFEIIVVNDGSTDDSFTEAVRFKKFNGDTDKIHIFHYAKNVGKGFALRLGFQKSVGDPVVFLDGDMDIETSQVVNALNLYQKSRTDMVLGSKYHPRSRIYYPFNRYLYSLILKGLINLLFHLSVSDTQVGLKVFRREVLQQVFPRLIIKRFAVDLEFLVVAKLLGFDRITEIPVIIRHTSANSSTINLSAVKNFCWDITALWYRKNVLRYYSRKTSELPLPSFAIQIA